MIESNIINWLDFGDFIQKIDSYSKTYLKLYFEFFRILIKYKSFPIIIDLLFIIISFIQIITISSVIISSDNDLILKILHYLKDIILIFEIIDNEKLFFKLFFIMLIFILIDIFLMIIIILTMKNLKLTIFINIINLANTIIYYYLIGPALEICLMGFWCEKGMNKFINEKCFSNSIHLKYCLLSVIIFLLYILISILFSIYFKEIGSISTNLNEKIIEINNNYKLIYLIIKIIIFIFYFVVKANNNRFLFQLFYLIFICIISINMSIYVYKYVYFYNNLINYINLYGWLFSSWFLLFILFKILFHLKNISFFIIIGWALIILILYKKAQIKKFFLISEYNISEMNNIKNIESFKNNILAKLYDKNNIKAKILLHGIIKKFDEFINNNPELNNQYLKLTNDKYLKIKYNKNVELPILSIIYILYLINLEKSSNKDEISFYMSYFLINKFNNSTYAIYLCSKIKASKHINLYFKYLLEEDIKEHLLFKLNLNSKKESIKHVQLGTSVLYNLYLNLFKLKIFDAVCNQIDYFDLLKEGNTSTKNLRKFLKKGEKILELRKDIILIWSKIIKLNPFSDEAYQDYNLYLDEIIQDQIMKKEENKKYLTLKNDLIEEKYNNYYSLFLSDISSIILVDGNFSNDKIIYSSPNFQILFTYTVKELINLTVDDLLPNSVQPFHKELVDEAIKYSNINYIFKNQKNTLLKTKNGGLFNIKLFVKTSPNLKYGLIYFIYLQKIKNSQFIIELDKDLRINGFTQMDNSGSSFTIDDRYDLSYGLYGLHIGLIIPDILTLLEYNNGEFIITKINRELKGYLYSINKIKNINSKVDIILEKLKNNTLRRNENQLEIEDAFQNINDEYNELIKELIKENIKPYSIFYIIKKISFLDEKYKYYKIYINDDIITEKSKTEKEMKKYDDIKTNQSKYSHKIKFEKSDSFSSKEEIKTIKKKLFIKKRKRGRRTKFYNIDKIQEASNIEENIDFYNINEFSKNKKIKDDQDEWKKSKISNNYPINIDSAFNKIKLNIINKKEIYPIIIMIYLFVIFIIATFFLITYNQKKVETSFNKLSAFLDENIFFNMTKMTVAVLYITSLNIKWQLHSCNLSIIYNLTSLYEETLKENIFYLGWIKNFTNNLGIEFQDILMEKHDIILNIYGTNEKEKHKFNFHNLLSYFINSEINLLNEYPFLLKELNKTNSQSIDPLTFGVNELNDLVNQTYLFFFSGINGFHGGKKKEKINEIFNDFPTAFLFNGIIFIILLILGIIQILRIYNIETYFVKELINFNCINFENYLKKLDEIKKKIKNDNSDEDKDDIDINDSDSNNSLKEDKDNNYFQNNLQKIKKTKAINLKKQNQIIKQKKNKITKLKSFFFKNNLYFGIKVLSIMIITLSYYIFALILLRRKKNEFLKFDSINASMIGIFKECYDIFISLKRELELHEQTLNNCKIESEKDLYEMKLPIIYKLETQILGNSIVQIASGSGYNSETISKLTTLFKGDCCKLFSDEEDDYIICKSFWNGILGEGIEQTIIKMDGVIGEIIQELKSINKGGKSFNEIIMSSYFIQYELFIEFYYQKSYRLIDEIFWSLRNQKLDSIFKKFRIILIIFIIISFSLCFIFIYLILSIKDIFYSFINFIGILPFKYLIENENFIKGIMKIINDNFLK